MPEENKMKPVIILPIGEVSKSNIRELRKNGICVVEAKDPSKVYFKEPPPMRFDGYELACIRLSRYLLDCNKDQYMYVRDIGNLLAKFLMEGVPLKEIKSIKK